MAKQKFTASQVIEALDKHKGMVYLAANALQCSHNTIYNYARRYKSVQEAIDRNRGQVLDTAELALYNAVLSGEHWAVTFALRTIGRKRGYVEKQEQEITGAGGGPVETRDVTYSDDQRANLISAIIDRARARNTGPDSGE